MLSGVPSSLRFLLAVGLIVPAALAQQAEPFEEPPISYSASQTNDRATAINAAFHSRATEIRSMPAKKRLKWLLDELEVPVESQLFVFSKTSLQRDLINPEAPRVLYFSDEAYVGWSPTGAFEVAVFDAKLGTTFYIFEPHATKEEPLLARSGDCLLCHSRHEHTPSLRARSVFPDLNGEPLSGSGGSNIEPSTPSPNAGAAGT